MKTTPGIRPMTAQDFTEIWKRRRWLLLGTTLFMAASTCAVVGFWPSSYRSYALILIEQSGVSQDYVKPMVTVDDEQRISALVQQVLSHTMLERLPLFKAQQNLSQEDFDDVRGDASIELMRENTDPRRPAGKPYGLKVNFRRPTPKLAQDAANELAALVVQEADRMTLQQANETTNVLRSQLQLATAKVQEKSQALEDFKKQFAGQLPVEEKLTVETLSRLQTQLQVNNQAIERARQTISDLEATGASRSDHEDPTLEHVRTNLQDLKVRLADFEGRYKPNHPDVIKTRDQIERLESQVKEQEDKAAASKTSKPADTTPALPPASVARIQDSQAELAARLKEQRQIDPQIAHYQQNLSTMPLRAQQYSELEREYDSAKKEYETLRDQLSQAKQSTDVYQQHKGVRFRIQDFALLPSSPDKPVRWKIDLGGLAGALFCGLLFAAVLELRNSSLKSDDDVEFYMGLKNLAYIPDLPTPSESQRARRRQHRWITGTAFAAVALVGLNFYVYFVRM